MEKTTTDPDAYIRSLPPPVGDDMAELDALISSVMMGRSRVLWEGRFWGGSEQRIIGYGELVQDRPAGTVEWFVIGLAAQKDHISIYVNAADEDGYLVGKYADRLGKVKVGSAAIGFKRASDVDLGALTELVTLARSQTP